jgi:hypothetical protein
MNGNQFSKKPTRKMSSVLRITFLKKKAVPFSSKRGAGLVVYEDHEGDGGAAEDVQRVVTVNHGAEGKIKFCLQRQPPRTKADMPATSTAIQFGLITIFIGLGTEFIGYFSVRTKNGNEAGKKGDRGGGLSDQ